MDSLLDDRAVVGDASDEPIERLYRVWVDENLACIVRHCNHRKPGSKDYITCLSENCRRGVIKVPRDSHAGAMESTDDVTYGDDLADMAYVDQNKPLSNPDYFTGAEKIDSQIRQTHLFLRLVTSCFQDHCQNLNVKASTLCLNICIPKNGYFADLIDQKPHSHMDLEALEKPVALDFADDIHYLPVDRSMTKRAASPHTLGHYGLPDDSIERKRRVNDEVSQCIQSYCGKHSPTERLLCIIEHCHRTRSVYRR